ncbi:carcinoembryonic antigen-related cell adhesion molecule 15-like [Rattus rattus]|uniref:carcinoembryonic antigen-related cell adhesion molecule 15-like n=1 Tax=Rattus rattus TaxID=10117 RepID=UPI0013F2E683|nr:carcinoembryonic antigen-related cell adhesion molecule 15-like [Rattus rattus]
MASPLLLFKGLLLIACWSANAAMAQLSIEALPPSLPEGGNALLRVDNQAEKPQVFFWYKGKRAFEEFKIAHYETASQTLKWGPKYSGRERIYTNGSLLLQNVTQEDTGIYTLESFDTYYRCEVAHVHFQVFKILTQPYLRVNNIILERWKSAIFECLSPDTGVDITWFFNNKPLDFNKRMALSPEKRRLIIVPLRVKDTGEYQCEVSNSFSSRKSNPISLILIRM